MLKLRNLLLLICIFIIVLSVLDGTNTALKFREVAGSVRVYDKEDKLIYESINGLEGYQTPVSYEEIPESLLNAVIAAEDIRFHKHFGFDLIAMFRALSINVKSGTVVTGGSTITQQVSRSYLSYNYGILAQKYIRKFREINSAVYLELFYSKNAILSKYFSNVYLGNNSYGFSAASKTYFNKPLSDLSLSESALLAGSIKSPVALNASNIQASKSRRNEVLGLMLHNKFISKDQYESAIETPVGVNYYTRENAFLHFVEYSIEEAKVKLGNISFESLQGYSIYTTLDSNLSTYALENMQSQVVLLKDKNKLSNASTVVLDANDSAILVMLGSIDYFNEEIDGSVNVATSLRQPGSALKPFTYGEAFYEEKLTPESIILDEKTSFIDKKGESFVPYNYNGEFYGPITARVALASSLNLPAVKVLEMVGVENMLGAVQRAGIHTLNNPDRYDLSVTLGGGEVTLLEMSNAYNSLARGGKYKEAYSVRKITNEVGVQIYQHEGSEGSEVWGERSVNVANDLFSILSDPSAKVLGFGRNNVLILPFNAASKTGTTTDWHDNWTLGYTKDFTVGVWVGNSDNSPMYSIDGVTGAGPIWRAVMLQTHKTLDTDTTVDYVPINKLPLQSDAEEVLSPILEHYQIDNPAQGSNYFLVEGAEEFEKIAFEVSKHPDVFYVQYILNGRSKGTFYKENNFSYLWEPEKGIHTLVANFYNSEDTLIKSVTSNFSVL